MTDGDSILDHLSVFIKIISDLMCMYVKLVDEGKALLLLCSLFVSYDHMVITILYGNETLEMEKVIIE